ncbi:MAG: hypothetical protein FD155_3362 [Bacteroidetes bacterium]|nr:MAG: hypothetical protein FD155_3362 [Bacteroidota bacterium]
MFRYPFYSQEISFEDFCEFYEHIIFEVYFDSFGEADLYLNKKNVALLIKFLPTAKDQAVNSILHQIDRIIPIPAKLSIVSNAISEINHLKNKVNNDLQNFILSDIKLIDKTNESEIPVSHAQEVITIFYKLLLDQSFILIDKLNNLTKIISSSSEKVLINSPFCKTIPSFSLHCCPLKFFQWLHLEDGIYSLKKEFSLPLNDQKELAWTYDPILEVITISELDNTDFSTIEKQITFSEKLDERLKKEFKLSISLINEYVIFFRSSIEVNVSLYLKNNLSELDQLLNSYLSHDVIKRYSGCIHTIKTLKIEVNELYERNISPATPSGSPKHTSLSGSPESMEASQDPITFKWKKSVEQLELLHTLLTSGDSPLMVADIEIFIIAFSGSFTSQKKLVWLPDTNHCGLSVMDFKSLFHLFNTLQSKEFIEIVPQKKPKRKPRSINGYKIKDTDFLLNLANIISSPLKSNYTKEDFKTNYSNYLNRKPLKISVVEKQIDELIQKL